MTDSTPAPAGSPALPTRAGRRRTPAAIAGALLTLLALSACSGGSGGPDGPDAGPAAEGLPTSIPDDVTALDPGSGTAEKIDACALLTAAEVRALVPTAPAQGEQIGLSACEWVDRTTYNLVRIRIGAPGTVVGGTLPPPVLSRTLDGPDGIRFAGGYSIAEFEIDGRACQVDIINGKADQAQMVATVAKVRDRFGS